MHTSRSTRRTFRRTTGRRPALLAVPALVLALVLGAPTTAGATTPATTRGAVASWLVDGPPATSVGLQVSERVERGPGGSARTAHAFTFASTDGSCDEAADELVFRAASASGEVPHRAVAVAPTLASARARVTLPVTVTEHRFPDCDVPPTGVGGRIVTLPPVDVTVTVRWRATGPAEAIGPGAVSRPAVATATVSARSIGRLHLPATTAASISAAG